MMTIAAGDKNTCRFSAANYSLKLHKTHSVNATEH